MIVHRTQLHGRNGSAVDQFRRETRIHATNIVSANNVDQEETSLCMLMKSLMENVVEQRNAKSVEIRHHEAVVHDREIRRM